VSGRVHVVTGAGSGLGWHITTALLDRGHRVVANYASSGARLAELADEVGGDRLLPVPGDIAQEATSQELMARAADLGGVAAVIHNASVTRDALLVRMAAEDWDAVHRVNLRGAFLLTKHALRYMMRRRTGRLVYVSSIAAELGNAGQANYAASKSGLSGLSRSVAQEYARYGVTSCVLAAGLVAVGMGLRLAPEHQQAELARVLHGAAAPDDMAGVAAYLASEEARLINATVVHVDGGVIF
jgi:3-oxoacyl-[acyl-carrier protein] reductase